MKLEKDLAHYEAEIQRLKVENKELHLQAKQHEDEKLWIKRNAS